MCLVAESYSKALSPPLKIFHPSTPLNTSITSHEESVVGLSRSDSRSLDETNKLRGWLWLWPLGSKVGCHTNCCWYELAIDLRISCKAWITIKSVSLCTTSYVVSSYVVSCCINQLPRKYSRHVEAARCVVLSYFVSCYQSNMPRVMSCLDVSCLDVSCVYMSCHAT